MSVAGLDTPQLVALENDALVVVRELGSLGLSFFRKTLETQSKSDGSLVSAADKALEARARELLSRLTPQFGFVGEEFGSVRCLQSLQIQSPSFQTTSPNSDADSGLHVFERDLTRRSEEILNLDEDTYWILDPIDGTINFLTQVPLWSTLLALVHKGKPVLGIVALPALNEVFVASLGNGARWGALFTEEQHGNKTDWKTCRTSATTHLKQSLVSYSTPKTFAYRGIDSVLSVLQTSSRECRTHSDAFGYTRILCGAVDLMIDPLVAPYDVAALQILFDETPDAFFTTLQGAAGKSRFRKGSVVAAANRGLADEFLSVYRDHLISTSSTISVQASVLSEPLLPSSFQPTFATPLETVSSSHASKLWARAVETAVADFSTRNPKAVVEDVSILMGTHETASRAFSNGRNEGPPGFSATFSYHVRALVSGAAGLVTGTPDSQTNPAALILRALEDAFVQSSVDAAAMPHELLAARDQVIGHVGQHEWKNVDLAADFQSVSALIQEFHGAAHDPRLHSLKSRLNMSVEYRWQYFLDGAQQTFVTQACRVASNATCSEEGEKRTTYGRHFLNHIPTANRLRTELASHFYKIEQQALALLPAKLVPENPEYDYLAVDADLLGLILHEAIGHAAEGDLIQTCASGFGQNGKMLDLEVGPDWLDILIDGQLDNCGYLPVDAEGVLPRRKTLVRRGRLVDAIHTRQTARRAGKAPDGCSRLQSLQHPSLNRMTSIWVAPAKTKIIDGGQATPTWDDLPAHVIQSVLEKHGYLNGHRGVLLLSGWKGGTASCSNLEFRADVARVLHLKKGQPPALMREANFTGIATECFRSAVDSFGPLLCRSIGTCGKDGQGVLTSDGGPAFMVFKPNSKVRVIGTGEGGAEES